MMASIICITNSCTVPVPIAATLQKVTPRTGIAVILTPTRRLVRDDAAADEARLCKQPCPGHGVRNNQRASGGGAVGNRKVARAWRSWRENKEFGMSWAGSGRDFSGGAKSSRRSQLNKNGAIDARGVLFAYK